MDMEVSGFTLSYTEILNISAFFARRQLNRIRLVYIFSRTFPALALM